VPAGLGLTVEAHHRYAVVRANAPPCWRSTSTRRRWDIIRRFDCPQGSTSSATARSARTPRPATASTPAASVSAASYPASPLAPAPSGRSGRMDKTGYWAAGGASQRWLAKLRI
jgi:hypothetical protein